MSEMRYTSRGFVRSDFTDRYGQQCSIQKSSLAFDDECIWLGVDFDTEGATSSRMHLTQEMAADLIPLLQTFVATGDLPEPVDAALSEPRIGPGLDRPEAHASESM